MEPIAYLSCELKGRDLDSRALIAAHLVKRGYTAVFGQHWGLIGATPAAPKGYYLFKTSNKIQTLGMGAARQYGHVVVASDEEVLSAAEEWAFETTAPPTFDYCSLYLAATEAHKRGIHKAYPHAAGRVRVVGSSRFDLLRTVKYPRLHERPYVLFNTSFGFLNTIYDDPGKAINIYWQALVQDYNNPDHKAVLAARLEYERKALYETRSLIKWLATRDEIDIVIRPHPNERHETWRTQFEAYDRIHIVANSDAFPWIQHAALMVHSDSTTGLEAALMKTPVLNISPVDGWGDRCSLRATNYSVRTAAEAHDAIINLLRNGTGPIAEARKNDLFPRDCAEATAREMAEIMPPPRDLPIFPWPATYREDVQRKKFTVSPDEFAQSLKRAFEMAGFDNYVMQTLFDSVMRVSPRPSPRSA